MKVIYVKANEMNSDARKRILVHNVKALRADFLAQVSQQQQWMSYLKSVMQFDDLIQDIESGKFKTEDEIRGEVAKIKQTFITTLAAEKAIDEKL